MPGPHPSVAAVRHAVRRSLAECAPGDLVLVALSGGVDSMALAAATAFEAPRAGVRGGAVVVDHGLQQQSWQVAARAAGAAGELGLEPAEIAAVTVTATGEGLEAAARTARLDALAEATARLGARFVLLGHTLDDQAEQVLLGLARGAGARSLSGMPSARGVLRRPLLGLTRRQTQEACLADGLQWWEDPMNGDRSFARVRARRALGALEDDLGPGLPAALARSATQLRVDADHLDAEAAAAVAGLGDEPWTADELAGLPTAIRTRVWRRLLVASGAPAGQLGSRHTDACDALLTDWHGQGPVHAPGDLRVLRAGGRVSIRPAARVE